MHKSKCCIKTPLLFQPSPTSNTTTTTSVGSFIIDPPPFASLFLPVGADQTVVFSDVPVVTFGDSKNPPLTSDTKTTLSTPPGISSLYVVGGTFVVIAGTITSLALVVRNTVGGTQTFPFALNGTGAAVSIYTLNPFTVAVDPAGATLITIVATVTAGDPTFANLSGGPFTVVASRTTTTTITPPIQILPF